MLGHPRGARKSAFSFTVDATYFIDFIDLVTSRFCGSGDVTRLDAPVWISPVLTETISSNWS